MKIAVIGTRDPVLGFSLAGIKKLYLISTPQEAEEALTQCMEDSSIGIILIEKTMIDQMSVQITGARKKQNMYPIILPIPGSGDI